MRMIVSWYMKEIIRSNGFENGHTLKEAGSLIPKNDVVEKVKSLGFERVTDL